LDNDLLSWKKFLEVSGHKINKIGITYLDHDFINLLIQTENETTLFYTVTRKFYEKNIFLYDELFYRKLIPFALYKQFSHS
jgi:hypothetical protein